MQPQYKPGALAWLTAELEVGSETFPVVHRDPRPVKVPVEVEQGHDAAARIGWPGEGWWCE